MPKKIEIKCYGPIAVSKTAKCPWEDVYMYWTQKPGRKKKRMWVVLDTKVNMEKDLESYKKLQEEGDADFSEEISEFEKELKILETTDIMVGTVEDDYAELFTNNDFIDRNEAEKMMFKFLRYLGINNELKFKWRRQNFIITPV